MTAGCFQPTRYFGLHLPSNARPGLPGGRLRWTVVAAVLLALTGFSGRQALALDGVPAVIGSTVPLEKVTDLKSQPLALLAKFPDAGNAMARYVAQMLHHDPSLVDSILSVVRDTSPEQASAIGAGLVRGLRAFGAKQPNLSRAITEKVMKSDNLFLKTTFHAIGPRYSGSSAVAMADKLPPPPRSSLTVGEGLPDLKSRIGPENLSELVGEQVLELKDDSALVPEDGMIVALMLSDASRNGAVSTSPTQ